MSFKKITYFLLVAVFLTGIFFLCSCSQGEKTADSDVIKIGVPRNFKSLSGEGIMKGTTLAAEEINEQGGVLGKKIELVFEDTEGKPEKASSATEKLITVDKVDFLVGENPSEACLAVQEKAMDYKIIYLSVGGASPQLTENVKKNYDRYKYYFRFECLDSYALSEGMVDVGLQTARAISDQKGIPLSKVKAALLAESALWAEPVVKSVQDAFKEKNIEIVYTARPSREAKDLTAELTEAKDKGAHMIYTIFSWEAGYTLVKQWYDMKIPCILTGYNSVAQDPEFWNATGGKGIYTVTWSYTTPRVALTPKTIPFYDAFVERWGHPPRTYRANSAYNNIYILAEAIKQAGTTETEKVLETLENISYEGVMGVNEVDEFHNAKSGPSYLPNLGMQWLDGGKQEIIYPDELKTADIVLPPWME